jgi:hypothetical protein
MTAREAYLRETNRFAQLWAEGYITFGVHNGGRDKYTPPDELDRLCAEVPDLPDTEDPLPEPAEKPIDTRAEAVRLRKRGMPTAEIATVLRMPPSSVRGVLHRAGAVKRWNR